MEWWVILILLVVISVILLPAILVWYVNIGGLYVAIKERRLAFLSTIARRIGIGLRIVVPLGVYAFLIWFFLGHFGWPAALALGLALPIMVFVPVMIWAAVASGLYLVIRETLRQRATVARRRRALRTAEETVRAE